MRLARAGARRLVLVDHAEASLVAVDRTLRHELGYEAAVPVLADIKSGRRMVDVFREHGPDTVFHAAAYKQVPLLEAAPVEGVATNVFGTKCVLDAALAVGVERFVLFSTDKAVGPTNVLGRSKAVAEWLVAAAGNERSHGGYASVRLGNVVDSAGSILPVFRRQALCGGPVTVTHPSATRHLMTAGEAAGLAIAAGGMARSTGNVFWLDSGPPRPVVELARRVAATASPDVAIDFVGLRAGERLHEHMFLNGDEIAATPCAHVWRSTVAGVDPQWLDDRLTCLARHVRTASADGVRAVLAEMLPAVDPEAAGATDERGAT